MSDYWIGFTLLSLLLGFWGYAVYILSKDHSRKQSPANTDEPNVNELDFESLEYLVSVIGEDVQTDYQLKVLARYRLLKGKKPLTKDEQMDAILEEVKNLGNDKKTLPDGFTIEHNEYNGGYYPKYGDKYIYKVISFFTSRDMNGVSDNYCSSERQARRLIEEYYSLISKKHVKIIK